MLPLVDPHVLPEHTEIPAWVEVEGKRTSGVVWMEAGTRAAAIVTGRGAIEARGWRGSGGHGPWAPLTETFREGVVAVAVADLGMAWDGVQVRVSGPITEVAWELTNPVAFTASPLPPSASLPASVVAIGVVSREQWGARATQCSSTESEWYRMAIHHTAGYTTYSGSVAEAVRLTQAYAQDSGEYCDLPYQFMVGYDGSFYEGRELRFYSGATGNNNDGNIAVCFVGCFHPDSCPNGTGDAVTEEMIDGGQLLVQTLVAEFGIPSDEDSIRGHRDWPDNATACPGDWLHDRLDDLRSALADTPTDTPTDTETTGTETNDTAPEEPPEETDPAPTDTAPPPVARVLPGALTEAPTGCACASGGMARASWALVLLAMGWRRWR